MVDLHCHILPEVDDGAQNIEQSLNIAREAEKAGFTTICCTSHFMIPNYTSLKSDNEILLNKLQKELDNNEINIKLLLANEIYINESILELLKKDNISTIGESEYLLVELPMRQEIKFVDEIFEILKNNGYKIILAHPERYKYIQDNPNRLINLIEEGVIIQSNYASILGFYGNSAKKTFKKLLKSKMINILATDNHYEKTIYENMENIRKKLHKIISDEYFNLITIENPDKVIKNEEIKKNNYTKIRNIFL